MSPAAKPPACRCLSQQHPLHVGSIRGRHQAGVPQLALAARRLLGEDAPLHGMPALDLPARGELEALGRRAVGLELQLLRLRLSHCLVSLPSAAAAFLALPARAGLGAVCSFLGERICTIVMPSWRGGTSMSAVSVSSAASRFRIRRPISLCTISRPRKITVDFTLLPSLRNRSTLRFLIWKSCSSILGRNFTSLTWMWRWCLRASDSRF